ncbi:MAG: TRAP transporter small permease [Chloroflexi bacterium]|nr:TRAP transporter small permease [Chloroflexota bacterium]
MSIALRLIRYAETFLVYLSSLFLFTMMVLIVIDVSGRAALNQPLKMGLELTELLMVFIVYLGFSYTQWKGGFIRIELFLSHFSATTRWILGYFDYLISITFFVIFTWRTSFTALESLGLREVTPGLVPLPMYPAKISIALGGAFMLLELIIGIIQHGGKRCRQS